jgi:hypothetical protein
MKTLACALILLATLATACASTPENVETHGSSVKHKDGRYTEARYENESYSMTADGGGLRITIPRVKNDYVKHKVVVTFELRNDFDREVRFELNAVRMSYAGQEYAALSADLFRMDPHPNVLPKTFKKGAWAFELGQDAKAGVYDVRISGIELFGGGSSTPVGKDFTFQVKVPGPRG